MLCNWLVLNVSDRRMAFAQTSHFNKSKKAPATLKETQQTCKVSGGGGGGDREVTQVRCLSGETVPDVDFTVSFYPLCNEPDEDESGRLIFGRG